MRTFFIAKPPEIQTEDPSSERNTHTHYCSFVRSNHKAICQGESVGATLTPKLLILACGHEAYNKCIRLKHAIDAHKIHYQLQMEND